MRLGSDRLLDDGDKVDALRGKRVGLVANNASRDSSLYPTLAALAGASRRGLLTFVRAYAPEHGYDGLHGATERVPDAVHHAGGSMGVTVRSLYSSAADADNDGYSAALFGDVDTLVVDLQDVGVRFYTYIWTLYKILRTAARDDFDVIVLDRPNPLGSRTAGPVSTPALRSFVGLEPLPLYHGRTIGELALLFNGTFLADGPARLRVTAMSEYTLPAQPNWPLDHWCAPSPNLPTVTSAWLHAAVGLADGLEVSLGQGTPSPFTWIGSPSISEAASTEVVRQLQRRDLPGVAWSTARQRPTAGFGAGEVCGGFHLHLADPARFQPLHTGLALLATLRRTVHIPWKPRADLHRSDDAYLTAGSRDVHGLWIDRLVGSDSARLAIDSDADIDTVLDAYTHSADSFDQQAAPYQLYPREPHQEPAELAGAQ